MERERENKKSSYSRVLQSSVETRMQSIQGKIMLAFTFCSTVEIEITYGHPDRAKQMLRKLGSTLESLTDHINNPEHVSGKQRYEFQKQLIQLRKRLLTLESHDVPSRD